MQIIPMFSVLIENTHTCMWWRVHAIRGWCCQ